jgi:hypothetical protein
MKITSLKNDWCYKNKIILMNKLNLIANINFKY